MSNYITKCTIIGALPGAGSSIANILSYDIAKKMSKNPGNFGKGTQDGIIAAESANNSLEGGALIPTLALGIPESAVTVMMMGAAFSSWDSTWTVLFCL